MPEKNIHTTRRSALKLVGGTAVGAVGFSGASSATETTRESTTDDDGNGMWILRFGGPSTQSEGGVDTAELKESVLSSQREAISILSQQEGYSVGQQFWLANAALVKAKKPPETAKAELSALSGVEDVHPNFEMEGPEPVEKQTLLPEQDENNTYGLEAIHAPEVWEQFDTQGEGTSVAVLDTGIDPDHPDIDLAENGWAFFDGEGTEVDSEPFDPNGHGTHVSGTISGGSASGVQIGVAPETELYNAKVLDNGGTFAQIVAGMQWAVETGVDVINMSLGGEGYSDVYIEPIQNAIEQGTIVVSSSGNDGEGTSGSPANVYDSFAIGATDAYDDVASFSSGERIRTADSWTATWLTEEWPINYYVPDVSAPGVEVVSAYPGDTYAALDGTSMASPHVAGAIALLLSVEPDLAIEEIKEYVETTAVHGDGPDATPDSRYGAGIINTLSAVTAASGGNVVEGTVTYDGEPVPGVVVESDYGTEAETNEDGAFSLYLADGEWTLSVDEFGLLSEGVTVDVTEDTTLEEDIELVDELSVQVAGGQPDVVDQGEPFDVELTVANLEAVTVCVSDETEVSADEVTLAIGGEEIAACEPFALDEPTDGSVTLTVEVAEDATLGSLALDHEFEGLGDSVQVSTGPTSVMADPEPASFEIVDWDETAQVDLGSSPTFTATVENTGDYTDVQEVQWWLGDPNGVNVFAADVLELTGGGEATVEFSISIPATLFAPGTEIPHGWQTSDDLVQVAASFDGSLFTVDDVDAPEQVDYGDTLELTATLTNNGTAAGSEAVYFSFDGLLLDTGGVAADAGGSDTVTFEFDSTRVVRDRYEYLLEGPWAEVDDVSDAATFEGAVWIGEQQVPAELEAYVNDDLVVDTAGLQAAIDDWRAGEIGTGVLNDVITSWRNQEPVA